MTKVQIKNEKITPFGGFFLHESGFLAMWVHLSTKCCVFDVFHMAISTTR